LIKLQIHITITLGSPVTGHIILLRPMYRLIAVNTTTRLILIGSKKGII